MVNVRNLTDMAQLIALNVHKIDRTMYDVVVGIPRSGMIPATLIATHLQLPLADISGYAAGIIHGRSGARVTTGNRVLLVDDSCNKGRAMARAVGLLPKGSIVTRLAIFGPYQLEHPEIACDIWFEVVKGPRAFAWNIAKHRRLSRWGFDFDGVLCRDCTSADNDDGPHYMKFLKGAEPLLIPQRPIGPIITCRLEKYRAETEAWLRRHRVTPSAIHMMPYATKQERMREGNRGGWKATIVKQLELEMFIESSHKQATIIAREAGIPVWCFGTQTLVRPS